MKKLSLLLISLFVCSMSWAANPIPNILATDLRYVPHPYLDSYYFSFYVNTKPAKAIFRFYKSYDKMKQSINVVHDDLYNGTNTHTPDFIYEVPASKLRQGKIEVEFKMAGGKIVGGKITEPILPPGEWYWSVYVEAPRRSTEFGVMARVQGTNDATNGKLRGFATVNNYPETDMFGSIIMAVNPSTVTGADDKRTNKGLYIFGVKEDGNSNDEKADITSTTRYVKRTQYLNANMTGNINDGLLNYPRRLTVGPDGKVYIADVGMKPSSYASPSPTIITHDRGGVKMWDPAKPTTFKKLTTNILGTATDVAIRHNGNHWNLYATNTYDEGTYDVHGIYYTGTPSTLGTKDQVTGNNGFGRNGYVQYMPSADWTALNNQTQYNYKKGDGGGGNMDIVAMDKGIWFCQGRNHTVAIKKAIAQPLADCLDTYILAFMPYGSNDKTWTSCINNGTDASYKNTIAGASDLTQKETSPVQATPGGGLAYRKYKVAGGTKEYLYLPNHDGNIARLEITSWSGNKPSIPVANVKIFNTPSYMKATQVASMNGVSRNWTTGFIMTMEFDYAGNLVTVAGTDMFGAVHDIIVYTMPYPDRVNAQEIQAPNSCRFIPERLSQNDMNQEKLDEVIVPYLPSATCYLDLYRPLQGGTFNTITLPFDLSTLNNTPYAGAEVRRFTGTKLENVGGENLLYFNFEKVTFSGEDIMKAGQPYVIMPKSDVVGIVSFDYSRIQFKTQYSTELTGGDEYGKFVGFFPYREMASDPETLMLVSDNRLAEIEEGTMNGFRAYFHLLKAVPANTLSMLHFKKDAPTGMEIVVDGKVVNVEKLLRDGRVYIRAGETLYTITGEVVGDRR